MAPETFDDSEATNRPRYSEDHAIMGYASTSFFPFPRLPPAHSLDPHITSLKIRGYVFVEGASQSHASLVLQLV